jgi:hypothetical protein
MTLLTHLPALAVGFDHLGPFAAHLGMMVEVALVLAVLTTVLTPASSMTVQRAIAALAGAIFSNRMLVLIYNLPGGVVVRDRALLPHQRSGGKVIKVPVSCEDWRVSKFNLVHEALYKCSHLFRLWLRNGHP